MPLLIAVRDLRPAAGFLAGLLSGTLFFALLLRYIGQFGLLPWLALATFQGLFVALFGFLASLMWRCPCPWVRVAAVGASWTAGELLRGHFGALQFTFGGLGYSQHRALWVLQLASLVGHYGLGSIVAFLGAAAVEAAPRFGRSRHPSTGAPAVILGCVLFLGVLWGALRIPLLHLKPTPPSLSVLAVQGNVEVEPAQGTELISSAAGTYIRWSLEYLVYMRAAMTKKFRYFSLARVCVVLQFNQTFAKQETLSKEVNNISSLDSLLFSIISPQPLGAW